jgi:fibronectin-binding autotransporter adhesin
MQRTTIARLVPVAIVSLCFVTSSVVRAASDTWKFGVSSNWETPGAWTDGSTPVGTDTATLGFATTYTTTFGVAPVAIQNLTVNNGGTVTFTSSGGTKALNVTSATGAQEVDLGTNTTLILGTSGNAMNLVSGSNIAALSGSDLEARFGSHLTAVDLSSAGLGGTIVVNGAGSLLTLSGSGEHFVGGSAGSGSIVLQNSSASANISGSLGIGDAAAASGGNVSITGNSTMTLAGDLKLATQNLAGSSGTLSVSGATTSLIQSGSGTVSVGSFNNGAASVNVAGSTSATLTTGTGGLSIKSTGSVNVGGGALVGVLNVNGDIFVTGGGAGTGLTVASGSTFTHAAGKNMFVQSGGQVTLNAEYFTPANQAYFIDGANSKVQVNTNDFVLGSAATAYVTNGGTLSGQYLSVGTNGNGTLTVDGPGSTAIATSGSSSFGLSHSTGTVTFSNGGTGSFAGGLALAQSLYADTSANVMVKSGSHLTSGLLSIADSPGNQESPSATVTVTDASSTITISAGGTLQLSGPAIVGNATLNVLDNGSVTLGTGGSTLMYAGAVLNVNGGYADLKTLNYNGGTINFTAGSLSYLGNLQVAVGGPLGSDLSIGATKQLTLSGTTTVSPFHTLSLGGGIFNTGSLVVNGTFNFTGGTLGITGASGLTIGSGGPFGSAFSLQAGRNLNVTNQTGVSSGAVMSVETGAGFTTGSLNVTGEFDLNGATATANVGTLANFGLIRGEGRVVGSGGANALANKAGGEIRAESGKRVQFIGNNAANAGQINLQGGTAEFANPLTNASGGQIVGRGTLKVGGTGLTNQGSIALASGITDVFGDVNNNTGSGGLGVSISGNAEVNFWDDVTNTSGLFKVNSGSTATFFGTFSGNGISGNASDIHFEADISPGFSPASVTIAGNVSLGAGARLKIELGGTNTVPAQFDQVHVGGNLSLDGTLDVSLINNFHPASGNSFDILDWSSLTGTFATVRLPSLAGGYVWDTTQLYTAGVLSVGGILGDYNHNGVVDAPDYVVWRKTFGQTGSGLDADGDGNGTVDSNDLGVWRAQFGKPPGSGSGSGASLSVAVPEPAGLVIMAAAIAGICGAFPGRSVRRK